MQCTSGLQTLTGPSVAFGAQVRPEQRYGAASIERRACCLTSLARYVLPGSASARQPDPIRGFGLYTLPRHIV